MKSALRFAAFFFVLASCTDPAPSEPQGTSSTDALLEWGEEVVCAEPTTGFDRLTDQASERGFDFDPPSAPGLDLLSSGGVVSTDLDDDGDIDILIGQRLPPSDGPNVPLPRSFPRIFANDGFGYFSEVPGPDIEEGYLSSTPPQAFLAVDIDGDRLPEIVQTGAAWAGIAKNLGGLQWGPMEPLFVPDGEPEPMINTAAFGDMDADGDLDLILPAVHAVFSGQGPTQGSSDVAALPDAHPHLLYRNDDGVLNLVSELEPYGRPNYSQMAIFTDRDSDGDQDIFVVSEFGGLPGADPSAFFRNDGPTEDGVPLFVNDSPDSGTDLFLGGMGIDSADLNRDGTLDYCIAQFGPLTCLLSDGQGAWFEGTIALGLAAPPNDGGPGSPNWSAYSLDFVDLENDGDLDLAVVAGNTAPGDESELHVDRIFEQIEGGTFVDRSEGLGWDDPRRHFGLGVADYDADGSLDLFISSTEGRHVLWMNQCTEGAWIEIDLIGPPGNREGHGAQVRVEAGGQLQLREQLNLRSFGQGPARIHFGLGDADRIDRLEILWAHGERVVFEDLPVRRRFRALSERGL